MTPLVNDSLLILFGYDFLKEGRQGKIILTGVAVDSVAKGQLVFVNSYKENANVIVSTSILLPDTMKFLSSHKKDLNNRTTLCFVHFEYLGILPNMILGEIPGIDVRRACFGGNNYEVMFDPENESYQILFPLLS